MAVLLHACNLELLPLALVVGTLGLDVLALLPGAQLVAVLPWLRAHTAGALRITGFEHEGGWLASPELTTSLSCLL